MKKKWIVPAIAALLIPIAIAGYIIYQNLKENLGDGNIIECVLGFADHEEIIKDESEINMIIAAIESGEDIDEPANSEDSYIKITAELKKLKSSYIYTLYLSSSANDCIYKDESGKYYRIPAAEAEDLLSVSVIENTVLGYLKAPSVALSSGENKVESGNISGKWYSKKSGGEFEEYSVSQASNELYILPASDKIEFSCKLEPDFCDIKISRAEDEELLFSGKPEELSEFSLSGDEKLSVAILCEWYETDSCLYYGKLEYDFDLFYDFPASCKISSENAASGTMISLKIENSSSESLAITSGAFSERPEILGRENKKYAFIMIPASTPAGTYDIAVLGSDIEADFKLNVSVSANPTLDFPIDPDAALSKLLERIKLSSTVSSDENIDGFCFPVPQDKISFGSRNISASGKSFGFIKFTLGGANPVCAAGNGTCIFSGETEGLGRTIIISHGSGLYSVYAGLDDNLLNERDSVVKGAQISNASGDLYFGIIAGERLADAASFIESNLL